MTAYKLIDKIMPNMDKGITLNIKLQPFTYYTYPFTVYAEGVKLPSYFSPVAQQMCYSFIPFKSSLKATAVYHFFHLRFFHHSPCLLFSLQMNYSPPSLSHVICIRTCLRTATENSYQSANFDPPIPPALPHALSTPIGSLHMPPWSHMSLCLLHTYQPLESVLMTALQHPSTLPQDNYELQYILHPSTSWLFPQSPSPTPLQVQQTEGLLSGPFQAQVNTCSLSIQISASVAFCVTSQIMHFPHSWHLPSWDFLSSFHHIFFLAFSLTRLEGFPLYFFPCVFSLHGFSYNPHPFNQHAQLPLPGLDSKQPNQFLFTPHLNLPGSSEPDTLDLFTVPNPSGAYPFCLPHCCNRQQSFSSPLP